MGRNITSLARAIKCVERGCKSIVGRVDDEGKLTGSADQITCARCKRLAPSLAAVDALPSSQDAGVEIVTKLEAGPYTSYTPAACPECGWTEKYWSRHDAVRAFVQHRASERQLDMLNGETFAGSLKPYSD